MNNPGEPSGNVATLYDILSFLKICEEFNLLAIIDEAFQDNIWCEKREFVSASKVAHDNGLDVQIISLNSTTAGYQFSPGMQGGFVHFVNVDDDVIFLYNKLPVLGNNSINVSGQMTQYLLANPPKPGEPSYDLYEEEKQAVFELLKKSAEITESMLDGIPGLK
jgi:alanine transaminase